MPLIGWFILFLMGCFLGGASVYVGENYPRKVNTIIVVLFTSFIGFSENGLLENTKESPMFFLSFATAYTVMQICFHKGIIKKEAAR